ncbi:MAG: efflux RND transporter permease subunit [Candidatus Competibacteraceae bacterium]|jgi:multidrug efflux pump subunit AcrB|nr:efflux RND transporter permease subunit [Candidatus Competibacteraceae bacterium]
MLARFLGNHVLANLTFAVVLVVGTLSYLALPREQDPTINFNWIDITTTLQGASAEDMEKQITDVLEDAIRKVSDVRFVSSNSREGVSSILVRFQDIDDTTFDKRVNDLRREIQNKERELPDAAETPAIFEVTTANAFPSATLVVTGPADDENLRWQTELIKEDLERVKGVDNVITIALNEPELQVNFFPERLESLGLSPGELADTVIRYYRDVAAGTVQVNRQSWLIRVDGADSNPQYLAGLPIVTAKGEVPLGSLAAVERGRREPDQLVRFAGQPAVLLAVNKQPETNLLELVERVNSYIEARNQLSERTGVRLVLVDDQTLITRTALRLMQNNALVGLLMVLLVTWVFLGSRIALLTCIGIPFILAGTFWLLSVFGQTLNVTVLLGVVISLGMLVDDAVVVVEAIFYRLQRGIAALPATLDALREVFAPVTTAVLTTMAAFLPLMLLPGILGKFMLVIPLVVTTALAISLVEAYWMLPAHVLGANLNFRRPSRIHTLRVRFLHSLRVRYTRLLIRVLRYPKTMLMIALLMFAGAFGALATDRIKVDFFAADTLRLFYVNVTMPPGTPLQDTLAKVLEVEAKVRTNLKDGEARALVSYAGQAFSEIAPLFGDQYGQILVGLNPKTPDLRTVEAMIEDLRPIVENTLGPLKVSFLRLAGGPPVAKPISVKVRGDDIAELRAAVVALQTVMAADPTIIDIANDDNPGPLELQLRVNQDAAQRVGIDPAMIARTIALLVDGEIVTSLQDRGETLDVRVRALPTGLNSLDDLLRYGLPAPNGGQVPLAELVHQQTQQGQGNIRHYNFRRAITVEADIDKTQTDTVKANQAVLAAWEQMSTDFPGVGLDFSGELDDIQESLDAILVLFLFGVGLIYLILGTQFKSYFQPFMILATVPLAFTGVVLGLLITDNPLSLYTMYGVVALAGIAVNAAIVLISAANDRLQAGMSLNHAILYAARRRVVPVLITSLTTVAGLFSLATGLAGKSLIWGPVATAIVWGLGFSTILTLLVIPLLYRLFMVSSWLRRGAPNTLLMGESES